MRIGYARVSTQDQNPSLQIDALTAAGCEKIYKEKASGARSDRPELTKILEHVREGDAIVIWKLDRLGRSLAHLVQLVAELDERKIGLISLNNPIDTTSAQGRLVFGIFASLAEFEREQIRERTVAGLTSARRRGVQLGRRKGISEDAQHTARVAESLYNEGTFSVKQIAEKLKISKTTLYEYLRSRGVRIGAVRTKT